MRAFVSDAAIRRADRATMAAIEAKATAVGATVLVDAAREGIIAEGPPRFCMELVDLLPPIAPDRIGPLDVTVDDLTITAQVRRCPICDVPLIAGDWRDAAGVDHWTVHRTT